MTERTQKRPEDGDRVIAPLYARLPRGPHQLGRGAVAENQRQRMHGAMVEAVATNGYGRTSVKQIVSLAGVSRRAFYEQFANKQDCFLATLDLVADAAAEHVAEAYRSADGGLQERTCAALGGLAELVNANPKSAHVVLIDAPSAGAAGWARLTRMLFKFEQMLAAGFAGTPGAWPLSTPVVRGTVGGLHRLVLTRLRQGRTQELLALVEDMLSWTLATQAPTAVRLHGETHPTVALSPARQMGSSSIELDARRSVAAAAGERGAREERHDLERHRARVLDSALHAAALEGYDSLSPLRIADHAGLSIDTFFSLFGDMEQCFLQAFADLSDEVRATTSNDGLASSEWSQAVARALERLMRHFAAHPTHAHMIAMGAFEMGSPGTELNLELAGWLAGQLTQGAPCEADSAIVQEGIAGAIWHTVYCHAASRRIERLPAAADHLAYVVLAPFLGAERAVEILTSRSPSQHGSPRGERIQRPADRVGTATL